MAAPLRSTLTILTRPGSKKFLINTCAAIIYIIFLLAFVGRLRYSSFMETQSDISVRNRFFAPVDLALAEVDAGKRKCPSVSDRDHIMSGISRVLGTEKSGRGWVQHVQMAWGLALTVDRFFDSLRSQRRLDCVAAVAAHVRQQTDRQCQKLARDPFAAYTELNGFALYASDGHYEKAAAHTPAVEGEIQPQGFFYAVNLRTHSTALLDIARPARKKEHDIHALKRITAKELRMGEPPGVKVILAYDSAIIDYVQWKNWKTQGLYVISREKDNSAAQTLGLIAWDRADPRNTGVLRDEYVGSFSGCMMRRVTYQDPCSGTIYTFLTSEFTLPPGLIALIYKMRWDIEKVFDEKKNKLGVVKTWATTPEAKCQQAHFVCMARNLILMLEREIETSEGVRDEKVDKKREARRQQMEQEIVAAGRTPNPLVTSWSRAAERSLQFVRWLRYCLNHSRSWRLEIEQLKPYMEAYIC